MRVAGLKTALSSWMRGAVLLRRFVAGVKRGVRLSMLTWLSFGPRYKTVKRALDVSFLVGAFIFPVAMLPFTVMGV